MTLPGPLEPNPSADLVSVPWEIPATGEPAPDASEAATPADALPDPGRPYLITGKDPAGPAAADVDWADAPTAPVTVTSPAELLEAVSEVPAGTEVPVAEVPAADGVPVAGLTSAAPDGPVLATTPDEADVPTEPVVTRSGPGKVWDSIFRRTPGVVWQPDDTVTQPLPAANPAAAALDLPSTCPECGGVIDTDGYCTQCGAKVRSPRDHYEEWPASWVAGVCDIGRHHHRNEDALATAASSQPNGRAVLVVCDGVTTSLDSDVASLAGARQACDHLWQTDPQGLGLAGSRSAAIAQAIRDAVDGANQAVIGATAADSTNPASATFAAALITDQTCYWSNLGDSRVYLIPDEGEPRLLSQDHSLAQAQIDEGVAPAVAEASVFAHTITRWLGRDAPKPDPNLGEVALDGSGWVMVCSDGLWNYASPASAMAAQLAEALATPVTWTPESDDTTPARQQPLNVLATAQRLIDWANDQGGHDNITVALARYSPPLPEPSTPATPADDSAAETTPAVPVTPAEVTAAGDPATEPVNPATEPAGDPAAAPEIATAAADAPDDNPRI